MSLTLAVVKKIWVGDLDFNVLLGGITLDAVDIEEGKPIQIPITAPSQVVMELGNVFYLNKTNAVGTLELPEGSMTIKYKKLPD